VDSHLYERVNSRLKARVVAAVGTVVVTPGDELALGARQALLRLGEEYLLSIYHDYDSIMDGACSP